MLQHIDMGSIKKYLEIVLDVLVTAIVALICFTLVITCILTDKSNPRMKEIEDEGIAFQKEVEKLLSGSIFMRYDGGEEKTKYIIQDKVKTENPAIVWWTGANHYNQSKTITCYDSIKCDVFAQKIQYRPTDAMAYLFYGSVMNFSDLPLPRQPDNILWGLSHEETPKNTPEILHDKILGLFNYSSTFSQRSDIPVFFHILSIQEIVSTDYYFHTKIKNTFARKLAPIIYMQSICVTMTDRDKYVQKLMEFIPIDCYGECLNNKKIPKALKEDYLKIMDTPYSLNFIARYKFIIVIENGVCDDYITEKFWRAIKTGVVPIYFGAPNIKNWLPNEKSAILITDYPTPQQLSEYIYKLIADDNSYDEHLEHKIKGKITNQKLLDNVLIPQTKSQYNKLDYYINSINDFQCFMCGKVHELQTKTLKSPKVMTRDQYSCARHMSALTLAEDPQSFWTQQWHSYSVTTEMLYNHILANKSTQFNPSVDTIIEYVMLTSLTPKYY